MEVEIYIMTYNIEKVRKEDNLRILGGYFVKNNMNKTKLIINNKKSTLKECLQINNNNKNDLKIKIIIDKSMYNMNYFFKDCYSLLKLEITDDYWKEIIKDDISYNDNSNNESNNKSNNGSNNKSNNGNNNGTNNGNNGYNNFFRSEKSSNCINSSDISKVDFFYCFRNF